MFIWDNAAARARLTQWGHRIYEQGGMGTELFDLEELMTPPDDWRTTGNTLLNCGWMTACVAGQDRPGVLWRILGCPGLDQFPGMGVQERARLWKGLPDGGRLLNMLATRTFTKADFDGDPKVRQGLRYLQAAMIKHKMLHGNLGHPLIVQVSWDGKWLGVITSFVYVAGIGFMRAEEVPEGYESVGQVRRDGVELYVRGGARAGMEDYKAKMGGQGNWMSNSHSANILTMYRKYYGEGGLVEERPNPDQLYMGVELETVPVFGSEHCQDLRAGEMLSGAPGFFLAKRDGSLMRGGIELISAPAVFEVQKEKWKGFFEVNKMALAQPYTCAGYHIHLNRAALTPMVGAKVIKLLNEDHEMLSLFTGRDYGTYCHRMNGTDNLIGTVKSLKNVTGGERYSAVNLGNRQTVELRIFKGTCSEKDFMMKLEFADGLVEFAKRFSAKSTDFDTFLNWLQRSNQEEKYPTLNRFIRGMVHGVRDEGVEDFFENGAMALAA